MRREGAKIALAAFMQLYGDSKQTDKSFEAAQDPRYGRLHAQALARRGRSRGRGPGPAQLRHCRPPARRRARLFGSDSGDFAPPRPVGPVRRPGTVGGLSEVGPAPADQRPAQEELDRYKTQARKMLKEGVERIKDAEPNPTIASAMLALAQLYLEAGEGAAAIATLEDPKFGPLTLADAGNPAAGQPGFAIETYKVAVRAYIGNHQIDKAKTVMDALDKAVVASGDANAEQMLTDIYVSLGRELQQQMERLQKEGSKAELEAVDRRFETFLARIGSRNTGSDLNSLNWAAESAYGLASNVDDPSGPAGDRAKTYYKQAATAYQQILAQAAKDPKSFPDPERADRHPLAGGGFAAPPGRVRRGAQAHRRGAQAAAQDVDRPDRRGGNLRGTGRGR